MLINKAGVRKLAIEVEKSRFPKYPKLARTRVSQDFFMDCEANIKNFIIARVKDPQMGNGKRTI